MKNPTLFPAAMALLVGAVACGNDLPDSRAGDPNASRGEIGKADAFGSCAAEAADYCGDKSDGSCWCDELCESYGDCCDDYQAICAPKCAAGELACLGCLGETFCVADTFAGCPTLLCAPCEVLDEGLCKQRSDCQAQYGPVCALCPAIGFVGCEPV